MAVLTLLSNRLEFLFALVSDQFAQVELCDDSEVKKSGLERRVRSYQDLCN